VGYRCREERIAALAWERRKRRGRNWMIGSFPVVFHRIETVFAIDPSLLTEMKAQQSVQVSLCAENIGLRRCRRFMTGS
jgi:hypothetical protein